MTEVEANAVHNCWKWNMQQLSRQS